MRALSSMLWPPVGSATMRSCVALSIGRPTTLRLALNKALGAWQRTAAQFPRKSRQITLFEQVGPHQNIFGKAILANFAKAG